ncbi:sarcosine oxidase subunit gamma [Rhizobium puerariae]|uniref:Sarcosine oxidase subunit gamma n=1 Tax=Rhizobium puerariae TaxID=1585791 RepID=A0ABV6AKC9_9HYPH
MPDLKPTTALGNDTARKAQHGVLTIEENADLALASLALRRNVTAPTPFGLTLPGSGKWVCNTDVSALWTGPDQWLLEGRGQAEADFAAAVTAQCPGCSVTDQTDGFVAFEILSSAGEAPVLTLMAKLVNLDPARLEPGTGSRTGLEHMSVSAIRRAADRLAVLGMRSAAGTLWHALNTTAARFVET